METGKRGCIVSDSVRADLPSPQRKSLRMPSEAAPKALRGDEFKGVIGRCIETALAKAQIEKKTAAWEMGYGGNQASLSNWIAGNETPQFAKLWRLGDVFRKELVMALAAEAGVGVVLYMERKVG